jgi:hypothetical protein
MSSLSKLLNSVPRLSADKSGQPPAFSLHSAAEIVCNFALQPFELDRREVVWRPVDDVLAKRDYASLMREAKPAER